MIDIPAKDQDKFVLRMPAGMRDRIADEAKQNGRSMNSEIVARLESTLADNDRLYELEARLEEVESRVSELYDVYRGRDPYNRPD